MTPSPNLFVVGMPRSGTRALSTYLESHPDIAMAAKELHYFGSDLVTRATTNDDRSETGEGRHSWLPLEAYLANFQDASARYRCDNSVGYLYSTLAASEIHAFCPDARIIVHLRNPVDMLHSWHSLLFMLGLMPVADFEAALSERFWWGPSSSGFRWRFEPLVLVRYAEHVARYLDEFGADRVHVVVFDDFVADPRRAYLDVLAFLGLPPDDRDEFPVMNANRHPRSHALHRALYDRGPARSFGRMLVRDPARRRALGRRLSELNRRYEPRPALDGELRSRLQDEFTPEVTKLGALLGRDFTAWSAPALR